MEIFVFPQVKQLSRTRDSSDAAFIFQCSFLTGSPLISVFNLTCATPAILARASPLKTPLFLYETGRQYFLFWKSHAAQRTSWHRFHSFLSIIYPLDQRFTSIIYEKLFICCFGIFSIFGPNSFTALTGRWITFPAAIWFSSIFRQ